MKRPRPAPPRSALPTAPRLAEEEGDAASEWHALSIEATYRQVLSDPQGLSTAEATRRLHTEGANTLDRVRADSVLRIAVRQINNPLIWVLFGAAAIAIVLGKLTDGAVVLAVVLLNSTIGFIQEHRASRAIEALRSLVPEHATVLRAGRLQSVPVASIVRGDLVQLTAGDRVPADMRLVAARNLRIEEAALTGESAPAAKGTQPVMADAAIGDRRSIAYSGTLVVSGAGLGVVVATGTRTELGRISELLQHADELEPPLTKALAVIGKSVTVRVLALALAIMAIGIWRATAVGIPVGEAVRDMLVFAIALAVGAIPEGLPAIVTIALAIGIQRMAARRAIIRNLPAVETLGSTTVICTDKTGTLTRNEMTVREVTDDNFATIVAAVEEGRRVYENLVKSLAFVLPTNLALALTLTCAVLWFPFDLAAGDLLLPITAPQLLWINLAAAVALALPLAFETHEPDVMRRPPRAASEPILSPFVLRRTALVGVLMTAGTVGVFLWEYGRYIDAKASVPAALAEAQTIAVTTMIGFQAFYMLNCRSLRESLFAIGLTSNRWVFVGIGTVALLQGAFIYTRPLQTVWPWSRNS